MEKKAITDRLQLLASDDRNRTKIARFRDVIDDIEVTLAAGVPHSLVVKELAKHGLEMSAESFRTTLKRVRQQKKKSLIPPTTSVGESLIQTENQSKISADQEAETETQSSVGGSHDPTELKKIFANKPDLAALAKLSKLVKRKK